MSYYAGNVTAEMATVLRKNATILIRLREKMEVEPLHCNWHRLKWPRGDLETLFGLVLSFPFCFSCCSVESDGPHLIDERVET